MTKLLFVCMGNICRSPTAHGVMRHLLKERGLENQILIDSAGTHAYHVGESPDPRSSETAQRHGISMQGISARKISINDYDEFDYILAMDEDNLELIKYYAPEGHTAEIALFLSYLDDSQEGGRKEVPDPYYGGQNGFEDVLQLAQQGCEALLAKLAY